MAVKRSTILWSAVLALAVILLAAWVDGGEEPLRTINQSVAVPEGVR